MSDYFEQEEIIKGYDADIMKRLLRYLKPYMLVFILSLVVLALATVGELYVPILLQRATDNHILPYHRGLLIDQVPPDVRERLQPISTAQRAGELYFLPASKLVQLTAVQKRGMRDAGTLLEENFYLVDRYRERPGTQKVIADHPQLFHTGISIAAITEKDLRSLSKEEIRIVRQANLDGLGSLVRILFAILLGVFIFTFLQVYLQAYVGQMIMKDVRTQLYDHTLRLSLKFIDRNPIGRLVSRVTNDVETINELFTDVLPALLKDFSTMIGVTIALFLLSPRLGGVTLLTLPPVLIVTAIFRLKARSAFRAVRQAVSRLNAFISEHISGMRIVQLFVQERRSHREFRERNEDLLSANLGEMFVFATFRPIIDLLATVSTAAIIYFGASFLLRDLISLGILIAFFNLIRMFYHPVQDLAEKYNILQSAMAGAERVFNLLDTDEKIEQSTAPQAMTKVKGKIEFDRVDFWYKEGEPVLKNLSFTVNPGETVAIVGYTGAGKTTITSLLTRLWDIQGGTIRLDGVDIRNLSTDTLRRRAQSVLQEVFLFSDTITENIRLGSDISLEDIEAAVKLVRADTFVNNFPEGLNTKLHERGGNLSMGQRQLLSFARVLAHDPDVLILDEATGNIDTETEKLIQEALGTLLRNRTSLVIAHRLSTIRNAHRIIVLHKGELFESGTHEELMARGGMYYNLYQMQYLDRETPFNS
ncbi:MAG: ABC transporter ATP-binding protein [Spirochaetaceae bacterium]|nr:MAG: ABC transporter ATP-binding protein [Spirochaetaceae bacterium]